MYTIGRVAGIRLQVHWTFLLLIGWVAVQRIAAGQGVGEALAGVVLVLLVFASVVVHELGHAAVARRCGIGTRAITLLPIGGVAQIDRIPERPRQELAIAFAGPATSVALAVLLLGLTELMLAPWMPWRVDPMVASISMQLAAINAMLAAFNLLPAFPMDGGRVLRALLGLRWSHERATRIAVAVGGVMAALLFLAGVLGDSMLILIALFVWLSGRAEEASEAGSHGSRALA